jgi:hypothetical protein
LSTHRNAVDRGINPGGVAMIKRPCLKAEWPGDRIDLRKIASGQDGARALVDGRIRDQLASVARVVPKIRIAPFKRPASSA